MSATRLIGGVNCVFFSFSISANCHPNNSCGPKFYSGWVGTSFAGRLRTGCSFQLLAWTENLKFQQVSNASETTGSGGKQPMEGNGDPVRFPHCLYDTRKQ